MRQQFIISPQSNQLVGEFGSHGFSNGLQHSVEIVNGAHALSVTRSVAVCHTDFRRCNISGAWPFSDLSRCFLNLWDNGLINHHPIWIRRRSLTTEAP